MSVDIFPIQYFPKTDDEALENLILNLEREKFIYLQIIFSSTKRKVFCYLLKLKKRRAIACNIYVLCNSVLPFVQGYGEILLSKAPI